eukprot:scaffold630_cov174-Amphora_coffeaeformis.AAC.28
MDNIPPAAKRTKLDVVQGQALFLVQELREELDRKEEALRQAGKVIGASRYTLGFDKWNDMPEMLRKEPGALAEYISQQSSFYRHDRNYIPEDVLQQALPQLLERHRPVAIRALDGGFLSWDEVNPTEEEYSGSEALFIQAIQRGLVTDVSKFPFQESISVYVEAIKRGIVTDISQISHVITTSVPLSVEALKRGLLRHSSQAPALSSELVLDSLRMRLVSWNKVPYDLKNDLEFCRAHLCPQEKIFSHPILGTPNSFSHPFVDMTILHHDDMEDVNGEQWVELARKVLDLHRRTLLPDRQVWRRIVDFSVQSKYSPVAQLFEDTNYQPIRTDIIRYACTKRPELFVKIDQVLHAEFVRELVIEDRTKLFQLKEPFLRFFPDFFIEQLALVGPVLDRVSDNDPRNLLRRFPDNVWTNHPNLIDTWIEVGLPLDVGSYMAEWRVDRDKLLWIAEHGNKKQWRVCSFQGMSDELANDIEFISREMKFEPAVLRYASSTLQNNNDLALWALSDPFYVEHTLLPNVWPFWRGADHTLPEKFVEGMNALAADLQAQQTFKNIFLMAVVSEGNQNSLGLLRNPDYLTPIRDYAGILSGNKLLHGRLALAAIRSALETRGIDIPTTWRT